MEPRKPNGSYKGLLERRQARLKIAQETSPTEHDVETHSPDEEGTLATGSFGQEEGNSSNSISQEENSWILQDVDVFECERADIKLHGKENQRVQTRFSRINHMYFEKGIRQELKGLEIRNVWENHQSIVIGGNLVIDQDSR